MKLLLVLVCLSCGLFHLVASARVVCYFPNWAYWRKGDGNFKVQDVDPTLCTDMIYAFAVLNQTTYNIAIFDPEVDISNKGYNDFVNLKRLNPTLKTTIAIGGWGDSTDGTNKYSKLVSSAANRKVFVSSVVDFLGKYKFDGLDFDWEYPSSSADKAGFSQLLTELRAAFGTRYLLSVAVAANPEKIDLGYDVQVLNQTVDYINLMTYDMHGPWENRTDHHSPLYKRPDEVVDNNVDFVVNHWLIKGMSPGKIILGVPTYGTSWILGESAEPKPITLAYEAGAEGPYTREKGTLGYHEICANIRNAGWQSVSDPENLNGPFAYSSSYPMTWVGYDDPKMAAIKSQYVLDNQLGGAMVWDMSTDDFSNVCGLGPNPMMTTISDIVIKTGTRFVCYFPNWTIYRPGGGKYSVENINASLCTDLIYSFASLNGATNEIMVFDVGADITNGMYAKFVDLKKQNSKLKTTIAIGGWTDSHDGTNKYSNMVASPENRRTFIASVLKFLEQYKFDGLDLDWEYPSTPSDKAGFANLMQELRAAFGSKYLLSVAVTVNQTSIDNGYDVEVMAETADYVNIMAYDMHGPWENMTDNHAPLYQRSWDTDVTNNVDHIVKYWQSKGLPPSKINMGIPLYGKSWTLPSTYTSDPTLPAPGLGPGAPGPLVGQSGFLGYHEICRYLRTSKWTVVIDENYNIGPYASSPNKPMTWVGYDDPSMAQVKSVYALTKGLGGVMVWDVSTDDFSNSCSGGRFPILTAISRTLLASTTTTPSTTSSTTTAASTTSTTTVTRTPTTKHTTQSTSTMSNSLSSTTKSSTAVSTPTTNAPQTTTKKSGGSAKVTVQGSLLVLVFVSSLLPCMSW